jgi:Ca2+-binding EF-hand superfamily protein
LNKKLFVSIKAKGDPSQKLSLAFKMYDVDGNNKVDKKEMEKIIIAVYDLLGEEKRNDDNSPQKRVNQIMQKLDKDRNGYLTEDEFVNGK